MPFTLPDLTVPEKVTTPNALSNIASLTAIQGGQLANQKAAGTLDADIAQRQAESTQAQGEMQPNIDKATAEAGRTKLAFNKEQYQIAANELGGVLSDPSVQSGDEEGSINALTAARARAVQRGLSPAQAEAAFAPLIITANHNPQQLKTQIGSLVRGQMEPSTLASAGSQSGINIDNGQQTGTVNTNPIAGNVGQIIPGTQVQKQLPPTQQTFDTTNNQPGVLGPQSAPLQMNPPGPPAMTSQFLNMKGGFQGAPADIESQILRIPDSTARQAAWAQYKQQQGQPQEPIPAQAPSQPSMVHTGPPLGTEANIGGTVATVNNDWQKTQETASAAQPNIALLQNIKKFAPGAVTGVASDHLGYLSGLAGLLHMDTGELAKTNTDLLAKNANMLALAGGNTDLARTLAESANPNNHMTKEAIEDAANQLIGQQKLALAKQQFLAPFKANPDQYTQALTKWNQVADPRVFQYPEMSPQERQKMKASMTANERQEFAQKLKTMQHDFGVLQ